MRIRPAAAFTVTTAATTVVAMMFAALLVLLGLWLYESRQTSIRRAEERAVAASKIVATNVSWINALAWQALQRIDEALGEEIAPGANDKIRDINEAVSNLPGQVRAYVVDRNGWTVYSTDPDLKPINITDRAYFSALAEGAKTHVSSLLVSRLNGEQIFVFSRRLERGSQFAGAAMVSFEVKLLADVWEAVDLGENSTVSFIRKDGQLVARFPLANGPLDMGKYVLFTDYIPSGPEGTYLAVSPADGARRIVAYRLVDGTDFVALASADYDAGLRRFWNDVFIAAAVLTFAAIGLLAAGSWIRHLLRRDLAKSAELAKAVERNRLLFREIHHRVKNNLQSVQGVIRMQQLSPEIQKSLSDRISAMIAVHEQIYSRDQFENVSARDLLSAVVDTLVKAYGGQIKLSYDIDDIIVSADNATPLALLVNEIVTNSLKYAFADGRAGRIAISLNKIEGRRVCLVISDNGVGFEPADSRSGMGTRLIRGVMSQLGGDFRHDIGEGTTFRAEFAIAEDANSDHW